MAILDFWMPSGEVVFHGELELLLRAIIRVNGVLSGTQQFRCCMTYPKQNGISVGITSRGKISFVFQCKYKPVDSGFLISYRVFPGFKGFMLLLIPLCVVSSGILQFLDQGTGNMELLAGGFFACIIYPVFLWKRRGCIRLFLTAFTNK